jgi:hypothetical protein
MEILISLSIVTIATILIVKLKKTQGANNAINR